MTFSGASSKTVTTSSHSILDMRIQLPKLGNLPVLPTDRSSAMLTDSTQNPNNRPLSRQSTTSVTSSATQSAPPTGQDAQPQVDSRLPSEVWSQHEENLAQAAGSMVTPQYNELHIPGPSDQQNSRFILPQEPNTRDEQMERIESPAQFDSIEGHEGTPFDQEDKPSNGKRRKRGSAATQANDNELRRLFREHQGKNLDELAAQVQRDESSTKAEKSKQIFGMIW